MAGTIFRTKNNDFSIKSRTSGFWSRCGRCRASGMGRGTPSDALGIYVDLIDNGGVKATFETRAKIVRFTRRGDGFEAEPPMMQPIASGATVSWASQCT